MENCLVCLSENIETLDLSSQLSISTTVNDAIKAHLPFISVRKIRCHPKKNLKNFKFLFFQNSVFTGAVVCCPCFHTLKTFIELFESSQCTHSNPHMSIDIKHETQVKAEPEPELDDDDPSAIFVSDLPIYENPLVKIEEDDILPAKRSAPDDEFDFSPFDDSDDDEFVNLEVEPGPLDVHSNEFQCPLCEEELESILNVHKHFEQLHPRQGKASVVCCKQVFKNHDDLKNHVNCKHETLKVQPKPKKSRLQRRELSYDDELIDEKPRKRRVASTRRAVRVKTKTKPKSRDEVTKHFGPNKNEPDSVDQMINKHVDVQCPICKEQLAAFFFVRKHFESIHPDQELPYVLCCGKAFKTRKKLIMHVRSSHMNAAAGPLKTQEQGRNFIISDLRYKIEPDETDKFINKHVEIRCQVCNEKQESVLFLQRHFSMEHPGQGEARVFCCNRKFRLRSDLLTHLKCKHLGTGLTCKYCFETFDAVSRLNDHVSATHAKFSCGVCAKGFIKEELMQVHFDLHRFDNTELECYVCKSTKFETIFKLREHLRYHFYNEERKKKPKQPGTWICEICSHCSTTRDQFKYHQMKHKPKGDPVKCQKCHRTYKNQDRYEAHVPNCLKEVPWQICEVCSKPVKHLQSHMQGHSGECICPTCGAVLKSKISLKDHIKYVHKMQKTLPCRYCDKMFKKPLEVKDHEASSHTVSCVGQHLLKVFLIKVFILKQGETPFRCDICSMAFKSRYSVWYHKKKHHPELKFQN